MRFLTFLFLSVAFCFSQNMAAQERYRLVFWNVENLFDTWDDSTRNDDDFTPAGKNHWTHKRYKTKQQHLSQTLVALGFVAHNNSRLEMPLAIGMAEVENDYVLRELCKGTQLRRYNYDFVHFESPDLRGIDNALLYRSDIFSPFITKNICVSDSSHNFFTRDILLVGGTTRLGDTIMMLINHLPSKRNNENERWRASIAKKLRHTMDTLAAAHPMAAIIVMGDFNATPDEPEIRLTLTDNNNGPFINLMYRNKGLGSYKYQGKWKFLDQIIVSKNITSEGKCPLTLSENGGRVFDADFLLDDDERNLGRKVKRTYTGQRYHGGYSDHLPVYIDLERKK